MPKVLTEARTICPELTDAIKAIDKLAYTRQYSEVFEDFIDWLIWQYTFPPNEKDPLAKKYNTKEQEAFMDIFKNIQTEVRKRVNLWIRNPEDQTVDPQAWYDPLGRIYECITSTNKSSRMGQYFTPSPVVNFMTSIVNPGGEKSLVRILDPACGSGRMGLAGATQALAQQTPSWVTMNDLDPICTKMAAVNMALHGVVGEALCMNGLDITGDSYRFGYHVEPALAQYPQEMWEFYRMIVLMKTGQDIRKQYLLHPISYDQTFLKQTNDQLLQEYQERKKITDETERKKAVEEIKDTIKSRMAGTLFDGDTSQLENITLPDEKMKQEKKKTKKLPPTEDQQGSLF